MRYFYYLCRIDELADDRKFDFSTVMKEKYDTSKTVSELTINHVTGPFYVAAIDNVTEELVLIDSPDKLESRQLAEERNIWRNDKSTMKDLFEEAKKQLEANVVKPSHYQNFSGRQWLDTMSHHPRYADSEQFKAAVELQVRKYLDRLGRKDSYSRDLGKALWYMVYLALYNKNPKGDHAERVEEIVRSII